MSRERISAQLRRLVIERAHSCCEYCTSPAAYSTSPFSIDHIEPISRGGQNTLDNLASACQGCNGAKYNKVDAMDPVTKNSVPLYNPRQHHWHDHFSWSEDYTRLIGLTPIGRATISALYLNRIEVINLRRALVSIDEHPPMIYMS